MAMQQPMFRKAAMEKVSSPEQLDLLMQVTSPLGWLALATVGFILAVVAVWSVVGSIPDLVAGQGVLIRGERLLDVKATSAGNLLDIKVTPGSDVQPGQVLAVVERDAVQVQERLELKRQELTRLQAQHASEDASAQSSIARNNSMIGSKRSELRLMRDRRANLQDLVNRGLRASNVLIEADLRISSIQGEINGLEKENAALRNRMAPRANQRAAVEGEIQQLEGQLQRSNVELTSPVAGRVVEVIKSRNDKVGEGESIVRLEPREISETAAAERFCEGRLHAVMYVAGNLAGKVRVGHPVRVSPSDVKKEEYGYMPGQVAWVASFPASPQDMREKLKNDALVQTYSQSGAVYEVRVCLVPDQTTPSGFKWSSSEGPDKKIDSGALASADMVVASRKPISYVLPVMRETLGISG